jgi:hypothetical protein
MLEAKQISRLSLILCPPSLFFSDLNHFLHIFLSYSLIHSFVSITLLHFLTLLIFIIILLIFSLQKRGRWSNLNFFLSVNLVPWKLKIKWKEMSSYIKNFSVRCSSLFQTKNTSVAGLVNVGFFDNDLVWWGQIPRRCKKGFLEMVNLSNSWQNQFSFCSNFLF